jgi:hypothetical protein
LNLEAIVADLAGGGAGGAVLLAVIGAVKKAMASQGNA